MSTDDRDDRAPTRRVSRAPADARVRTVRYFGAQYRVERKLGSGGMGTVLLARDELLDRWVAIKVLLPEVADAPGARDRFRAEARTMARIRHPHVVGVHSFGEDGGLPYLVMEHVPGAPLHVATAARAGRPLPLDAAIAIVDQICRGVSAIHAAHLVHRDIKPGNVLVGPAGRIAIADLGLASAIRDGSASETWATPGYAAPEILLDDPCPPELRVRADVFSIAVITYELLTGRLPFATDLDSAVCGLARALLSTSPVVPPSTLVPALPAALDAVLLDALALDPVRRTRSADAFRRALLAAAETAPRSSRRRPRIVIADDDDEYRRLMSLAMYSAFPGAHVDEVSDGEAAMAAARRARPDLVVTDLDMPRLDGIALVGEIARDPSTRGVPVLLASACGSSSDWSLLCRAGAAAFVGKPFELQQLEIAARGVLGTGEPT